MMDRILQLIWLGLLFNLVSCVSNSDMLGLESDSTPTTPSSTGGASGDSTPAAVYPSNLDFINSGTFANTRLSGGNVILDQNVSLNLSLADLQTHFGIPAPVAYYPMEGTLNSVLTTGTLLQDVIGGNDCVVTNTDNLNSRFDTGVSGTSAFLDGDDTHCDTPFILNPADQAYTVMAWFKFEDLVESSYMIQQLNGTGTGRTHLEHVSSKFRTFVGGAATESLFGPAASTWYHMAVTVTLGGQVKLYVNGRLVDSESRTVGASIGGFRVGDDKSLGTYFHGNIDELAFFALELNANQISTIYRMQKPDNAIGQYFSSPQNAQRVVSVNQMESDFRQASGVGLGNQAYENNFADSLDMTGLIAHYQFESQGWNGSPGELIDSSGNGNHGRIQFVNDVFYQNAGIYGGAAYTDGGTSSYMRMDTNTNTDFATTEGTIELWFYYNNTNRPTTGYLENMAYTTAPNNDGHVIILLNDGSVRLGFKQFDSGVGWDAPAATYNTRTWYHFVFTYSSSGLKFYVNGVEKTLTRSGSTPDYGSSTHPVLGRKIPTTGSDAMRILYDEVAFYNRELTQSEVTLRYNRAL